MVDLSGLDSFAALQGGGSGDQDQDAGGALQEVSIGLIDEDPNNPRQEMDEGALKELADSIKARGVKSPVSLRSNEAKPGHFILNYGHRRLRASKLAGKETIPAFVDEDHEAADQVIENIQREALSTLDTARFIKGELDRGRSKKELAAMLGKANSFVSDYAAFFDLPDDVRDLYDNGLCTSMQVLANLHRAYKNWPKEVAEFCRTGSEFTASAVAAFVKHLREQDKKEKEARDNPQSSQQDLGPDQEDDDQGESFDGGDDDNGIGDAASDPCTEEEGGHDDANRESPMPDNQDAPSAEREEVNPSTGPGTEDDQPSLFEQSMLKNPKVSVSVDGRAGELMFMAATEGTLWVMFDDGDEPEETPAGLVVIEAVAEKE